MSAQATAAPATEEKKSKSLAPAAAILELQAKVYAKLNAVVDGTSASVTATEDVYYANAPQTREIMDSVNGYNGTFYAAQLGATGQKNIETLAANAKVTSVSALIQGADGVEYNVTTDRDYEKNIGGKAVNIKGRTTSVVNDASLGKTGQPGRVWSSLKQLAADSLK